MSSLICQECKAGTMIWITPPGQDLNINNDGMECQNCGHIYHGMGEWVEALEKEFTKDD